MHQVIKIKFLKMLPFKLIQVEVIDIIEHFISFDNWCVLTPGV